MRTRLLASVAVFAAALLAPSAALAVGTPTITAPSPSPFPTALAPVNLVWTDVDEIGYRVFKADADCVSNPVNLTIVGDLPANTLTYPVTPPGEGTYCYWVEAVDLDGFTVADSPPVRINYDTTVPTATLTSPGAAVRGSSVAVTATAGDSAGGAGVTSVEFQSAPVGSGTWTTYDTDSSGPSPYTGTLDTTALIDGDGLYDLRVRVTDGAGNVGFSAPVANVRVDNTLPAGALTAPVALANLGGTANALSANASDGGSGVLSVRFERSPDGTTWTPIATSLDSSSPYTANWTTTGLNATFQVRAFITDVAGNTFPTPSVSVTVDNQAPTAPPSPTGLTPVSATPTITFSGASDPVFPAITGVASGVAYYDVYRDGAKVNTTPITDVGTGPYTWSDDATSSSDPASGLHTYSYRVVAVDRAGNQSAPSGPRLIVLDPTKSSAPTSVVAVATPTNQRPQLSWVAPVAPFVVDHYNVYRNSGGSPVGVVLAPGTTFTDTTLSLTPGAADGSYTYQIVAASAGDATLGVASAAVAVTYDTTAPTAPGSVAASAALDGSVNIAWAAASDGVGSGIARYVVRRALSVSAPATAADGDATCQGTATSCVDATALNSRVYSYAVFAVDRAGNTSVAGVSLPVTARDQLAPAAPTGLTATAGDASVELHWTAAAADDDVAGYVLVAKPGTVAPTSDTDGTRVCSAIVAASTACTASGLTNGATYTFGLFALDEALNLSQAAVVSAVPNGRVTDTKAPAAVSQLRARVSGHRVTLTWKNPADKDFDHVVITSSARKTAARAASRRVYSGKGSRATTTLAAGQSRWFVVIAYDAVGNASTQAYVRASVAMPSRFAPAPGARVRGNVQLSWPVVKGARYYNVQLYAGKQRILVSWPAGRALQLPGAKLKRGTTYTWYVWPGLGAKAKAHYGKLIGKNVFTFTG